MYKKWPHSNRRKHERKKVNLIVSYREHKNFESQDNSPQETQGYALMLDLSEDGMALLTNSPVRVGTILLMQPSLIDASTTEGIKHVDLGEIKGEVHNVIPTNDGKHRVGISFIRIDDKDRQAILRFIKKKKR